jgi:lysozyme
VVQPRGTATATTDGIHAQSSWHAPMKGRNAKGCAVDLGFTAHDLAKLTAEQRRRKLVEFQLAEYRYAKRLRFRTYLELLGPRDDIALLAGKRTDLVNGSPLENQHDTHVHVARAPFSLVPSRLRRKPTKVSAKGVDMVATFEGFVARPSPDPIGIPTVGFGETDPALIRKYRNGISRKDALELLRIRLNRDYAPAVRALNVPTQNAFDALASFCYNLGPGALSPSTSIGQALRRKAWRVAADDLLAWDHAGGHALPGLTRRRRAERSLFLSGLK